MDTTKQAKKITITKDVRVIVEPPNDLSRYAQYRHEWNTEAYWVDLNERYEQWVQEFHEFIRDHRSQDPVIMRVETETVEACSVCREPWELMTDDDSDKPYCAYCGAEPETTQ